MSADIRDKDILDYLTSTEYAKPDDYWHQIAQRLQRYIVMSVLLPKAKKKRSGVGIKEILMVDEGGESEWVGPMTEVTYRMTDLLTEMTVDWCLLRDHKLYTRDEIIGNRGEERVINVLEPRDTAMRLRMAYSAEQAFFGTPDADNELVMWGLKYWIVKNSTTGFTGGLPTGFTRVGGVNLTKYPEFKNYSVQYTNATKSDLIKKLRKAHYKTHWISPVTKAQFQSEFGMERILFVNYDVKEAFEDIGEAQNENLGRDVAPFTADSKGGTSRARDVRVTDDGTIIFRKHPIIAVPYLDDDTSDPVYGIDMTTMKLIVHSDDNFRVGDYRVLPNQPRVFGADTFAKVQTMCTNRRANFVAYK